MKNTTQCKSDGKARNNGIALVAVLAVLTTLAILAAVFAVNMSIERKTSLTYSAFAQANLLSDSALQHVKMLLQNDIETQPAWDDFSEPWSSYFKPLSKRKHDAVDIDKLPNLNGENGGLDSRWIYVRNSKGKLIGRYAVLIEDESSKINVNVATALSPKMQNEGVGTFEIMLTDGKNRGLPITRNFGKDIIRYRYGRDLHPGQKGVDDNLNASIFGRDEIDNDADGIVDEKDEGIDEQAEYNPTRPIWDDRSFSSVREVFDKCLKGKQMSPLSQQMFKKYATVYTRGRDMYWDDVDDTWRRQLNLNISSKRQIHKMMRRANEETRFEASSKNLRILTSNIIDYRDENNALSTLGSDYGVESICFNEVMSNDGSYSLESEGSNPGSLTKYNFVHRFGIWYNLSENSWRYGWPMASVSRKGGSATVITNGILTRVPHTAKVRLGKDIIRPPRHFSYDDFQKILKGNGGWPKDLWKNAWLKAYQGKGVIPEYIYYPIVGNDSDTLTVGYDDNAGYTYSNLYNTYISDYNSIRIDNLWRPGPSAWCVFPESSEYWAFPTQYESNIKPADDLYYYVYIGEQNFGGNIGSQNDFPFRTVVDTPWKGYSRFLDVDGDPSSYSETEMVTLEHSDLKGSSMEIPGGEDKVDMLRYPYKDRKAIRGKDGFINVCVTTSKETGYVGGKRKTSDHKAFSNKNTFDVVYIMRPDIVELTNISDKPISLRNWQVVINTGSYADKVALIENAVHYSAKRQSRYEDPNPAISANGYFYLTNNREIFDREYGTPADGTWGTSAQEAYPCYELPDVLWGVRYKITDVSGNKITVDGANWKNDQMKYEMQEIHSQRTLPDRNGPTGIRKSVYSSGKNWLKAQSYIDWGYDGVEPGDDLMILGMPREGGFLSMTLKNEYNAISARTIDYGSVEPDELNYSNEKFDPTHYTWKKTQRATFGGTENKAHNHSLSRGSIIKPHVKNNPFSSVGEVQLVRKAEDWENIGMESRGKPSTRVLKSIAQYFTTAAVRLDPEEEGAHISGWKRAFGKVTGGIGNNVISKGCKWEPGAWKNHTLRMISGACKGERFPIISSTKNSVAIEGYSVPGIKSLRVKKGDGFSVGPGYTTPMFYTSKSGDEGIWEWEFKNLDKVDYGVYIYGLSDSIDTTEFLEENNNASIDVSAYNYKTKKFDRLPLPQEHTRSYGAADPYTITTKSKNHKYDKSDGFYCGQIHPEHISPSQGIKLKLVSHNINSELGSGFAWFDYVSLAPGINNGKININTAPEQVLSSLSGISSEIAHNLSFGINSKGQKKLKPYKNVTDILDVKGITPDIFRKIGNCITTRSDQFRVIIIAEVVDDIDNNGKLDTEAGDKILAQVSREVMIDRSELSDDDPETTSIQCINVR